MLFTAPTAPVSGRFTDKYRPASIAAFMGLDKAKKLCNGIVAAPMECALLFHGAPGLGKTTLGLALAAALGADLHHVPSQDCTVDRLRDVMAACAHCTATPDGWHVVLVDEADAMSTAAQNYLLSKLDATAPPARTIFVFTCNATERLEPRFLSRCMALEFTTYGVSTDATELLARVWSIEAPKDAAAPNFARIVKEANNNVRAALMELQKRVMFA